MKEKYWKVICRYGHVGRKNEVSVARYICTEDNATIIDVMHLVSSMPGVKNRGMAFIEPIDNLTYLKGKSLEEDNLYLQKLMTYNPTNQLIGGCVPCA
ncbi:hypothetical protein [Clostridium formicaceticum]|uniref:Uncharacterized protein n=1 Tax=Clostridium formicaceticum TaxID=1497 RepID=A0AAC9WHG0_9CLOT|nr:hypothetical protein [Clostridium formicaceticum]AOY74704.1 hypothetical protein BJL90_01280 [Clostridium formicaceticum]ARE89082.1 hypothetical protein CLFO_34880 [Clostridium formicaceticum]